MYDIRRSARPLVEVVVLAWLAAGCAGGEAPGGTPSTGTGGAVSQGGAPGTGGASNAAGTGGQAASGGSSGSGGASAGTGGVATDPAPTGDAAPLPDVASTPPTPDAAVIGDSNTPMGTDGGPQPSYEGEVPIYYGPEVPPIVMMNCPEDPTAGWTEYKDSFHLERPYDVPINTRFSITNGIYNFWVFPGDKPHSTNAMGRNPRTEATYGGTHDKATLGGLTGRIGYFTTGQRMYSADMLIEPNAVGSAIMQIHTTASGGGPIGLRINGGNMVNNGSLTVVQGSSVPGGLVGKWFNFKASLDASNQEVKIYVNNCLKSTYKGPRGDGKFYFKNGVYFCKTSKNGCFSHYKNVHLYEKK